MVPMAGFSESGSMGRIFQTAYVTNDLDRAVEMVGMAANIPEFFIGPRHTLGLVDGSEVDMQAALAWVGGNQIEIIVQHGGTSGFYRDALPDGDEFAIRHHHFCGHCETLGAFKEAQQSFSARGMPIVVSVEVHGVHAFYADTRAQLGHYLEYVWLEDESLLTMGGRMPLYGEVYVPSRQVAPLPAGHHN